jgi:hypothetical protein
MKRRLRQQGGVAILVALLAAIWIDAPAVADNEDDGLWHSSAFSRRSGPAQALSLAAGLTRPTPRS